MSIESNITFAVLTFMVSDTNNRNSERFNSYLQNKIVDEELSSFNKLLICYTIFNG
jgi:hypothetical protein